MGRRSAVLRTVAWTITALVAAVWVMVAWNMRSPYLLRFRETALWLWVAAGVLAMGWWILSWRKTRTILGPMHLVTSAAVVGAAIATAVQFKHTRNSESVDQASREQLEKTGRHLVVGWLGMQKTRALAAKGAIAGVFLTKNDFPSGITIAGIRQTVDELQRARRDAGLSRLWIATDQEGGVVSKLSPPLQLQAALGDSLSGLDGPGVDADPARKAEIARRVTEYADAQGKALAEAGINLNFAPVVDLRPAAPPSKLDFHSRIAERALSADPAIVALAAQTYVRVLAGYGITCVLKHFPGLARVPNDTHHFAATLDAPLLELEASDWIPFREISKSSDAGIMLSHVRLAAMDPVHPASCSATVMRKLREEWNFHGLLVTDDFSMTPIHHGPGGIVGAAKASMAAGVDLILISYDPESVYDVLAEAR